VGLLISAAQHAIQLTLHLRAGASDGALGRRKTRGKLREEVAA
jgi:hypothetical protein